MVPTERVCCLCDQIAGREENDLIARLLPGEPYVRRVMLESRSFALLPSLGPLVPGHSLLCPKEHVRSFAELDTALSDELSTAKGAVIRGLRELYGLDVHVFEHGMAPTGDRVVCTVDHAHLHLLPLGSLAAVVDDGWPTFDGSLASLKLAVGCHEYVSYEAPDGVPRLLVAREHPIESQYMRKVIARATGRADDWNWRTAPDAQAADRAWRLFVSSPVR